MYDNKIHDNLTHKQTALVLILGSAIAIGLGYVLMFILMIGCALVEFKVGDQV